MKKIEAPKKTPRVAKAPKSTVISTRVPIDILSTLDELCKQQGKNRSQFITEKVIETESNVLYKKGGSIQARTIPLDVQNLLTAAGVTTAGIISYNLIGDVMRRQKKEDGIQRFSDNEVMFVSFISALAIAMVGYGLVNQLTEM